MEFSGLNREQYIKKMETEQLDVLIIGGGITGAGIALDAMLRGLKVGLVEMQDFSAGTSSRSTKLVHGGLRYLKQFDVKIVAEVGKERAIVYENAPHVTSPEWMMLPFYKGGTFGKWSTSFGLKIYDFLAGVKKNERRYMLNKVETLRREPLLKEDGLIGSGVYVEYKTDDARLTIEALKKAVELGANAVNYTKVEEFIYEEKRVIGVLMKDELTSKIHRLYAKKIINATGVWVDHLREKDHSKKGKDLIRTKGVHLVFDQKRLPLKSAIYFDTNDGRMIFAIPREGKTYVGTTDTLYQGSLSHPRMLMSDRDYLLHAIHSIFPSLKLTKEDIESNWAGIRALVHEEGKAPSEISRRDEVFISNSGLISIAGGKLTGYRKMAEEIVDTVTDMFKKEEGRLFKPNQSINTPLSGGNVGGSAGFSTFISEKVSKGVKLGLTNEEALKLIHRYGSNVDGLFHLIKHKDKQLSDDLSVFIYATLVYGIEQEMVITPVDYFLRRTGLLLFDRNSVIIWKDKVISFMADYYKWDEATKKGYSEELEQELRYSIHPHE